MYIYIYIHNTHSTLHCIILLQRELARGTGEVDVGRQPRLSEEHNNNNNDNDNNKHKYTNIQIHNIIIIIITI